MNIALIGPSGVGKGTHVASLSARYGLRHVATGDLFRTNLLDRTPLGVLARKYMEAGALVPDEVVDAMIEAWAEALGYDDGTLFDGFPRTPCQADFLDDLLSRLGRKLDAVVYLKVSDEEVVARMSGRLICRNCQTPFHTRFNPPRTTGICDCCSRPLYHRPDDSPEMAHRRLRVFHRSTEPLLERYATEGKLIIVSGEGTVSDVGALLVDALDKVSVERGKFVGRDEYGAMYAQPAQPLRPPAVGWTSCFLADPARAREPRPSSWLQGCGCPTSRRETFSGRTSARQPSSECLPRPTWTAGSLVPDDVTDHMVEDRLGRPDVKEGFILDGYPRTLAQAVALDEILARLGRRVTGALNIEVPDSAIIDRLSARLICRSCQAPYHIRFHPPKRAGVCDACGGELYRRSDDNPATIRARLSTFHRQADPLLHYYRECGVLREIQGNDSVETVCSRCLSSSPRTGRTFGNRQRPSGPSEGLGRVFPASNALALPCARLVSHHERVETEDDVLERQLEGGRQGVDDRHGGNPDTHVRQKHRQHLPPGTTLPARMSST
jgi:adenylate kinase